MSDEQAVQYLVFNILRQGPKTKQPESFYGSAGNRSPTQENNCRRYLTRLMNQLTDTHIAVFTDGSCLPQRQSHCGAGSYIHMRHSDDHIRLSEPLGIWTNNQSELWAVAMSLLKLLHIFVRQDRPICYTAIHIFTDSGIVSHKLDRYLPKHDSLFYYKLCFIFAASLWTAPIHRL